MTEDKLSKFQNICEVIARTLKKKTRKEKIENFTKLWQFQYFYKAAKH
jgi:hypothetical protein